MGAVDPSRKALAGFMLGAAGMFATMYSTQAILPELSRDFGVSPSRAGLSISVVVLAVAVGGFAWGPVSDRIGRPRAIRMASLLLVPPTIGVALAPGFEALLVCRTLQGLCMPGDVLPLLVIGLACVAGAMFTGYTATQLGVSDVARVDRGAATALYFGVYYTGGALGAYLPGLAWQEWGWGGVATVGLSRSLLPRGVSQRRA